MGKKRDVFYLVKGAPGRCEKRLLRGKDTSGKGSVGPRAVIRQDGKKGQRLVNDGGWGEPGTPTPEASSELRGALLTAPPPRRERRQYYPVKVRDSSS